MKPSALKQTFAKYRFASICGAVALLIGGFAGYRHLSLGESRELLDVRSAEGERMQANVSNSAMLKEQTEELANINRQILARSVKPENLGQNLQYFYKIESATEAKTTEVKQTYSPKAAQKSAYIQVPYSISLQCDFIAGLDFLRRVEKGEHIARVTNVVVTSSSEATAANIVNMSINLELLGAL